MARKRIISTLGSRRLEAICSQPVSVKRDSGTYSTRVFAAIADRVKVLINKMLEDHRRI